MRRSKLVLGIDRNARCHAIYIRRIISIRPYARKINNIDEIEQKKKVEMIHISIIMLTGSHTTFIFACFFSKACLSFVRSFPFFPTWCLLSCSCQAKNYIFAWQKEIELQCRMPLPNPKNVIVSFIFSFASLWLNCLIEF